MGRVRHKGPEALTLLEVVLQLHGEFRRRLEPIRVTPLQAGVLLFLRRHAEANMTNVAFALRVTSPTLSDVEKDLYGSGGSLNVARLRISVSCICAQSAGVHAHPTHREARAPSECHAVRIGPKNPRYDPKGPSHIAPCALVRGVSPRIRVCGSAREGIAVPWWSLVGLLQSCLRFGQNLTQRHGGGCREAVA
jgi:hypothetical protein